MIGARQERTYGTVSQASASPCHDRGRGDTASFLVLNHYEAKFIVF